ncbi:MAG: TCP-1/cpn60 chaperonin family protein [Candidatus Aenigmatarchaeota archaeon]|nr:MAG: TCP-1/cpn60 chaperonin family protein [Candidatus Aenigmarchaeota archaeon]
MPGLPSGTQPIFILPEGTLRNTGKGAQKSNIAAARAVGDTVRTTLGPKGMDKMLVDSMGDIVITNDGVTILEEMEIEHPAAKMLVEVAKTQEEEVGDGTTTAVVIAAELLKRAEDLIDQEVHPTVIAKGYKMAREESLKILNEGAEKVDLSKDKNVLKQIAITAMTGKSAERASEHLAQLAMDAVLLVRENDGSVDDENIKLEKKTGGGVEDTELIMGVVVDKEIIHSGMPKVVKDAKIALLDVALEVKETETDAKIEITSPDQLEAFLEQEDKMLKKMVEKVVASGANLIFCQKGIEDPAQHYLQKAGVAATRRVKKSDMDALARATGARVVTNLDALSKDDLGYAKLVEEKKVAGERMVFVRECKSPKAVSILIRGGTEHVIDEIERAMTDAIGGIAAALETGRVTAGGGAPEAEVARKLRVFSQKYSGREQLAIQAFADALESIPRTLAENAGLDPIDILVELRAAHEKGGKHSGVDVYAGNVVDMWKAGVIEPLKIKTQAIKSASEAAEMLLRIDDIVTASKLSGGGPQMPPGGMDGM